MKKINHFLSFFIILLTSNLVVNCTDIDDNLKAADAENLISSDDELYDLILRTTKQENEPLRDINCIDFIYPVNLLRYDENLVPLSSITIDSDDDFIAILSSLTLNQTLSISYPISTTLEDGSVFAVNNNLDLKIAIESCSREDIISYCNGIFFDENTTLPCIWSLQYETNGENKYLSGFFEVDDNNVIRFRYDNETYQGSWFFLFLEDELHININLEGTSQASIDWNINSKVTVEANNIIIESFLNNILLTKKCRNTNSYEIGDEGEAGGIVFYDKGFYSNGWRYLEVATSDLGFFQWGCSNSSIPDSQDTSIGKGFFNSAAILNFHDNLNNFYNNPLICSILNNGTVVAKEALSYEYNEKKDWFLPSKNELELLYTVLHQQNIGNFDNTLYWSSTEFDAINVSVINFENGQNVLELKISNNNSIKARCIRYF